LVQDLKHGKKMSVSSMAETQRGVHVGRVLAFKRKTAVTASQSSQPSSSDASGIQSSAKATELREQPGPPPTAEPDRRAEVQPARPHDDVSPCVDAPELPRRESFHPPRLDAPFPLRTAAPPARTDDREPRTSRQPPRTPRPDKA